MARLSQIDPAAAAGRPKELLDGVKAKLGRVPNLTRVLANEPAALEGYLGLSAALGAGRFDIRTREAIALAVAGANACDYCASAHTAISQSLKVDATEISERLAGRSADPKLAAALAFTRELVAERGRVSDASLAAVKAAGHDEAAIVEIVANVALNLFTNYVNHVAETDIDFPVVSSSAHRVA
ncbi:carboxymuconolactone decarboxylase family protein [bacterium]|nr:carboxymuconolactone decarboxylase family protein [bacterium]